MLWQGNIIAQGKDQIRPRYADRFSKSPVHCEVRALQHVYMHALVHMHAYHNLDIQRFLQVSLALGCEMPAAD